MTIQDLIRLTRRRLGTIIICTVLGVGLAAAMLYLTPKRYTATSTAYVSVKVVESNAASTGNFYSASQLANQKAQAFSSVLTSATVAEGVIERLGLEGTPSELSSRISARSVQNSSTITVSAVGDSPERARAIADTVIDVAAKQLRTLDGDASPATLELLSSADLAEVAVSPTSSRTVIFGIGGGLIFGYAIAVLRSLLDRRIRVTEDVERYTSTPVIAALPVSDAIGREAQEGPEGDFRAEEALRKLRTNLKYASVDSRFRVCVVTSPNPSEGKSSVSYQLARVMALAGEDVVLIDADLRRPTLKKVMGIESPLGLSQVLADSVSIDQVLHKTDLPGLFVLPAGEMPPNPSELLGSNRMAELVDTLSKELLVILDAPPLLPVTDAAVLSRVADGVLLVTKSGKTKSDEMTAALDGIERAGGKTIGIVLNHLPVSRVSRMKYGDKAYSTGYYSSEYSKTMSDRARVEVVDAPSVSDEDQVVTPLPPTIEQVEEPWTFDEIIDGAEDIDVARKRPIFQPVNSRASQS